MNEIMFVQNFKSRFYFHCLAGDIAGLVPVIIMTPDRNEVERTQYTYYEDHLLELYSRIFTNDDNLVEFCGQMEKRQCGSQESDMNFTSNSGILGKANFIIAVVDQGSNLPVNLICLTIVCI